MSVSLLHFANARLGATFTALGTHGRDHRAQQIATLGAIADLARVEQIDAVLCSGDMFDCSVPAPDTIDAVSDFFLALQAAGIPAIVLPGARDPEGIFDQSSRPDGRDICPGATILGPTRTVAAVGAPAIAVHLVAFPGALAADAGPAPASLGIQSAGPAIGLAYRSGGGDLAGLAGSAACAGLSYLGVGGDTTFSLHRDAGLTICSPGVPEALDWTHEHGSVAMVRMADDGTVRVERRRCGGHSFSRRTITVTSESVRALTATIEQLANPALALEVVLEGESPLDVLIDPAALEAELGSRFFHLRIVDRTALDVADLGAGTAPQGTILGNFVRVMNGRLRGCTDAEQAMLDRQAYQIGMSLLQGGALSS